LVRRARPNLQVLVALAILLAAAAVSLTYTRPPTLVPIHAALQTLPLRIGEWEGREEAMDQAQLDAVLASDYALMTFAQPSDPIPVQLWIAYYDSQVQGASVHSPQACLPGGGWRIESMEDHTVPSVLADGSLTEVQLDEIERRCRTAIDEAVAFADESPLPELAELYDHVYVDER
jgi:hypothetical protein